MKRKLTILFFLSFSISGCLFEENKNWPIIDEVFSGESVFRYRLPPDMVETPGIKGRDSFVKQYTSETMEMSFDYGRWSNSLTENDSYAWFKNIYTSGRDAKLVIYNKTDVGTAEVAIHFPNVENSPESATKLTMYIKCDSAKIFRCNPNTLVN